MEQSGQPEVDLGGISQAELFMNADETQKKVILDKMPTVTDFLSILPVDLSTWSKSTTTHALEKALEMCALPMLPEDRSLEQVQSEQDKLQRQLEALKLKKTRGTEMLGVQRELKHGQEVLRSHLAILDNAEMINDNIEERVPNEEHRQLWAEKLEDVRRAAANLHYLVNGYELPFRDD